MPRGHLAASHLHMLRVLGFRVQVGFRVEGLGRVWGLGFRVKIGFCRVSECVGFIQGYAGFQGFL